MTDRYHPRGGGLSQKDPRPLSPNVEPTLALVEEPYASLMRDIAQGDRGAFLRLFARHSSTAMGLARRMLHEPHLAEETVQEAFLAVWRDPDRYRAECGTVRAWLMATVHHRAVDVVRREESQRKRATDAASVGSTDQGPADPCEVVVDEIGLAEAQKEVRRALDALRPEQRQVIELMYFDGLSQTQVSERLALPLGTVKSRARLGMRHMRAGLCGLR